MKGSVSTLSGIRLAPAIWSLVILVCWLGYLYYSVYSASEEEWRKSRTVMEQCDKNLALAWDRAEAARKRGEDKAAKLAEKQRREAEALAERERIRKQAELEEQERPAREEAERKAEEERLRQEEEERRLREEQLAQEQEDDAPVEDETPLFFPKPVKNTLPDLSKYDIPCKDEIPLDKDDVLKTWTWAEAEKIEMEDYPGGPNGMWRKDAKEKKDWDKMLKTCRGWKDAGVNFLKACPAAEAFPGVPQGETPLVKRAIKIDSSIGGWHSTGLYAPPGADIVASAHGEPGDVSLSLRIGCHTDSLGDKDEWQRMPEITMETPMKNGRAKMVNPMGGLVYIHVHGRSNRAKTFKVTITGATPAPIYEAGQMSADQWTKQLDTTKAPWGELRMPRLIVTMPIDQLKQLTDPQDVCAYLQKCVALQDWIMGWDSMPDRLHTPMRFVVDKQISAGAGHSGYPAMATVDWTNNIANGEIVKSGSWGLWHEIGHNHQTAPYQYEGQVEVTVNIYSMLCEVVGTGKDYEQCWGGGMGPYGMSRALKTYFKSNYPYTEAENKVQLYFWIELMYHLGFDTLRV